MQHAYSDWRNEAASWRDARAQPRTYRFGAFTFLPEQALLLKDDAPVRVSSRALDILACLVEQAGSVVEKQALARRVWPTTVVEEVSLRVHLMALRKALGDGENGARYIINAPGRGYRFVAAVVAEGGTRAIPAPVPSRHHEETIMPILNVQILSGRTAAQKKVFLKELTELVIHRLEVPESAVRVVLTEVQPDDWMVGTKSMTELRSAAGQ